MKWIWRSADYDFPVELTGLEEIDEATGRVYCEVVYEGGISYVPQDELILINDDDVYFR